jgi:hypothetical protein
MIIPHSVSNYPRLLSAGKEMYYELLDQMEIVIDTDANLRFEGDFREALVYDLLSDEYQFVPATMDRDQVLFVLWVRGERCDKLPYLYDEYEEQLEGRFGSINDHEDGDPERQDVFGHMFYDLITIHKLRYNREGKTFE